MTLTDYKNLFMYIDLHLPALIQVPSVRIWWNLGPFQRIPVPFHWNPVESSRMDAFLQESEGHQKVQMTTWHLNFVSRQVIGGMGTDNNKQCLSSALFIADCHVAVSDVTREIHKRKTVEGKGC